MTPRDDTSRLGGEIGHTVAGMMQASPSTWLRDTIGDLIMPVLCAAYRIRVLHLSGVSSCQNDCLQLMYDDHSRNHLIRTSAELPYFSKFRVILLLGRTVSSFIQADHSFKIQVGIGRNRVS